MCHKSSIFLAPSGASATSPVSGESVSQREARKKSPAGLFFYINALRRHFLYFGTPHLLPAAEPGPRRCTQATRHRP